MNNIVYTLYLDFKNENEKLVRFRIPQVPGDLNKDKIINLMNIFIENQEIFDLDSKLIESLGANIEGRTNSTIK
jgi:hypothetical protein